MERWLVKLKFRAPLHLGQAGIGLEAVESFARSDTLFGGICHAWAAVHGKNETSSLLDAFCAGKPHFKVSSAFPFKGETYFLPRPLMPLNVPEHNSSGDSYTKELNRMPFVPRGIFKQWVQGKEIDLETIPAAKEELTGAAVYHMVPRVQLDRVTSASGLFHAGMTVFSNDAGLYCLVDILNQEVKEKLEGALAWLGDSGLGGLRSIGYGKFEAEWIEPDSEWRQLWDVDSNKSAWCLLSLTHPSYEEREFSLEESYFEIITRDGWASSPFSLQQARRKSCRMFAEGSVLTNKPIGSMADVTPTGWDESLHPLYRFGFALAVPAEVKIYA
jgi:CRISPR-associated protein Csm4